MNHQPPLQQTLRKYSHLDLTPLLLAEAVVQVGAGGCSDVFKSKLSASWQPRADSNIAKLLKLKNNDLNSSPEQTDSGTAQRSLTGTSAASYGIIVAVK